MKFASGWILLAVLAISAASFLRADEPPPARVVFTDEASAKWTVTIRVCPTPDKNPLVSYPLSLTDNPAAPVDAWWKEGNGLTWDGVDQVMTSSIEPSYGNGVLKAAIDLNWTIWRKSWWRAKAKYRGAIRKEYTLPWMQDFEERTRAYTLSVRWTRAGVTPNQIAP
jgi:hypothetical protein